MNNPVIYQVQSLASAREYLSTNLAEAVILTNPAGSTKYYGMLVLDYIFKTLRQEFPQVIKVIVNVEDDYAAFVSAVKLHYDYIVYNQHLLPERPKATLKQEI